MVALRPARPVVFSPLTPGRLFADSVESAPLRRRTFNAFNLCELDVSDPHHAEASGTDRRLGALFSAAGRAFCTGSGERSAPVVLLARSGRSASCRSGSDRQIGWRRSSDKPSEADGDHRNNRSSALVTVWSQRGRRRSQPSIGTNTTDRIERSVSAPGKR